MNWNPVKKKNMFPFLKRNKVALGKKAFSDLQFSPGLVSNDKIKFGSSELSPIRHATL